MLSPGQNQINVLNLTLIETEFHIISKIKKHLNR